MDAITVDIGNSTISLAAFTNNELTRSESIPLAETDKLATILTELRQLCGPQPFGASTVPVVVASVNDTALTAVEKAVAEALDQNVFIIGKDIPLPIKVAVENPETVGVDRLLTAAAAYDMLEQAVVVADFGTATTINLVSAQGIFLGGAIMPGLNLAAQALHQYTAALPEVPVEIPTGQYGINTTTAIQHGIYYSAIGALRNFVERYADELGTWPHVVLTGGFCQLIAQHCDFVDSVVPTLCHTGIYLTFVKYRVAQQDNQDQKES
ncbi:MAG: type III pantothenate kinase [Sedimentisphaerales bacterium]|nr:type III pantothenate kinase [Sedimentisphaerales bacterium]